MKQANSVWAAIAGALGGLAITGLVLLAAARGPIGWALAGALLAALGAGVVQHAARWRTQSLTDSATGLFNRRYMLARLEAELLAARSARHPVSFVVLEIDDMKRCNDTFGHLCGDALLAAIARELRALVRPGDTVVRWGGDEFGVILPGADTTRAYAIAERLRQHIEVIELDVGSGNRMHTTVSVGVASQMAPGPATELIERADQAMYRAKRRKNQVALAMP
ncbi:MAG TPA: GGDEF domain-containing protein [Roseiflexaceae bacterium]|nr:GGDEF domain-containing protein [Roseiflexaceae bacterium]